MMSRQSRAVTILALLSASFAVAQTSPAAGGASSIPLPSGLDKRFLDTAADPCVDFAQYACGNFTSHYPIPAYMSSYGPGAIIFEHTEQAVHSLLDKVQADDPSRTPNEQKVGDFYASCMDTNAIQAAALKPLQPEFDRIAALKDKKELTDLLAHYQLMNVTAFFNYFERQDFKDARKQIAGVDQAGLGLPERDYYLRTGEPAEKTRQQYVQHLTTLLKLLGEPEAKAASDAQKIMELETALAKISMDVTSRREPKAIYHPMTVAQLAELTPGIDWVEFFARTGTPPFTELNVVNPEFFEGLQALLESTDLETIKTYLRWQLVYKVPLYALPAALDDEQFNFFGRQLHGLQQQPDRWKRCAQATEGALGEAVGEAYVKAYFPPENKEKTVQMVKDIEGAMDQELDTLSWMSPETRLKAKEKLRTVADKIGYPDRWRDYSSLKIVRGDALGNATRAVEFENRRELKKIGQPVDRGEWIVPPTTVDAYYSASKNDINFPAGILQSPFFAEGATDAENYGHIGSIVGHELTHGFDDQGRKFDAYGNLSDWWTAEDAKKYESMTDCEVKEYDSFTAIDDLKVNGKLTLGENTADNGGLRLALVALQDDAKRKGIDLNVKDDSGFTPLQQFFLAYGQNWCGTNRPEQVRLQVQTNPHSPREFRLKGAVQNMPEFGQAFGCKAGQPMMPVNACRVW
jgi:endothelin-converting enzyme/putative endopeptidase